MLAGDTINATYVWLVYLALLFLFVAVCKVAKWFAIKGRISVVWADILSLIFGSPPVLYWISYMEEIADNNDGYMAFNLGFFIFCVVLLFVMRGFNKLMHEMEDRWK